MTIWQSSANNTVVARCSLQEAELSDGEAFHNLRIRAKKLRYTMEIVKVAFEPCFRKRLYRRVVALQDVMGMVIDHTTAKTLFSEWTAKTDDAEEKAYFQGLLLAETRAREDFRQAFYAIWEPKAVRKLQRQFRACCGFS
jgi:CHAD domain-containing protein